MRKWSHYVVVMVLAALMSAASVGMAAGKIIDGLFVNIDGHAVTLSEFREYVANKLRVSVGDADDYLRKVKSRGKLKVLTDGFIDVMLIRLKLESLGDSVTDNEVRGVIKKIVSGNNLTEDEFKAALEREGLNFESYRTNLLEEMEKSRIIRALKRKVVLVTDDEVKRYYVDNRDRYTRHYKVDLKILSFPLPDSSKKTALIRFRELISGAERLVSGGADIEEVKAYLHGKGVSIETSSTGLMSVDDLSGDLKKEVSRLATEETSSSLIVGERMVFVKVKERKEGEIVPFNEVKDSIREELVGRRSNVAIKDILKELHQSSYIEVHL
jgi:peptidyl-prolyl cis-trans isomerase SurA